MRFSMPHGFRGWASVLIAQAILTFVWHWIVKLAEHAMLTWGNDQIASLFGFSEPPMSTVISWAIPALLGVATLFIYHMIQTRDHRTGLITQVYGLMRSRTSLITKGDPPDNSPAIAIISPVNGGVLEDGRQRRGRGCSYIVRIQLTYLPNGHKIWVLHEDPRTGAVWPQDGPAVPSLRSGEWECRTFVWDTQTSVTIVAVVAPPTSHEFFKYYHKAREQIGRVMAEIKSKDITLELRQEDQEVLPITRLPPECKNIARIQARHIGSG
jgi:hypothetical protein